MTLNSTGDGTIFGTFKSGVERRVGASGGTQVLRGHVGVGPPTTLGFTVTFNVSVLIPGGEAHNPLSIG